jgi:hypothetical protein
LIRPRGFGGLDRVLWSGAVRLARVVVAFTSACIVLGQSNMKASKVKSTAETVLRWFLMSAVLILAATALAKGIGASGDVRILSHSDPLLGLLTNRQTMLLAVVLEVLVIVLVVREREIVRKTGFIAWISTVFIAYRVGLWSIGYKGSCGCLGSVTNSLGIAPSTADLVSGAMLAYMLIGSYAILVWKAVLHVRARRGGSLATAG